MSFDVLLEILGALERFLAEVALVGLQRNMDTNVRGDMITLHSRSAAIAPSTGEVQVVGRLATNVTLTDMFLNRQSALGVRKRNFA